MLAAIGPHLKESRYANGAQNSTTVPKWLIPCTVPDWMATGPESLWPDVWVTSYEESIVAHVTADFTCAPLAPPVSVWLLAPVSVPLCRCGYQTKKNIPGSK